MNYKRRIRYLFLLSKDSLTDVRYFLRLYYNRYFKRIFSLLFGLSGIISIITLTMEFGYYYPESYKPIIKTINQSIIYYLIFHELSSLLISDNYKNYILTHKPEVIIIVLIIIQGLFKETIVKFFWEPNVTAEDAALSFLAISQIFFIFSNTVSFLRSTRIYNFQKLNPSFMFFASFGAIILIGTFFLSMPKLHNIDLDFIDIMFTVISATCVTGLSTIDISYALSFRGQLTLLFLIQVGGLGLITLTSFFAFFLAGQASVKDTMMMKDLLSEDAIGKVIKLIKGIAVQTLIIELLGAIYLFFSLPLELNYSTRKKIFFAIFHSISAFCNAGFSIWSEGLGQIYVRNEFPFLFGICGLIILGGLGFGSIREIYHKYLNVNERKFKISVSTKLSITTSFILLLTGMIGYYFLENSITLNNMKNSEKFVHSFFYSVTTRTTGFNTLDIGRMGIPITFFTLFLMWVGASPNSTGGGIKTTTLSISFFNIYNYIIGRNKLQIFNRQIAHESQNRASITIVLSLFVIFSSIFLLVCIEPFSFLDICFEVVSAYGTVGLSRGITSQLQPISKSIICFVMFSGRVGILTILIAMIPKQRNFRYSYPAEYVIVG